MKPSPRTQSLLTVMALSALANAACVGGEPPASGPGDDSTGHVQSDGGTSTAGGPTRPDGGGGAAPQSPLPEVVQRARDPRSGAPYPVVLVHGLNGFRDVGPLEYYFRVPHALEQDGQQVFVTAVSPYNGSAERARLLGPQLDDILRQTGAGRVNIIAHSQGGIDSRYLISSLGYGDRVASLTTISSPHHGTEVADRLKQNEFRGEEELLNAWAWLWGVVASDAPNDPDVRRALDSLSVEALTAFNRVNRDDPRVQYFSFAGRTNLQRGDDDCAGSEIPNSDAVDAIEGALLPTWLLIAGDLSHPKANDGLVSVQSSRWGRFMGCIPADHLDEIGQIADITAGVINGWDHVAFYVNWVRRLRTMGL